MDEPHNVVNIAHAEAKDKENVIPLTKTQQNEKLRHERWLQKEQLKQETLLLRAAEHKAKEEDRAKKRKEQEAYRIAQVKLQQLLIGSINRIFDPFYNDKPYINGQPAVIIRAPDIRPAIWCSEDGERHIVEIKDDNSCDDKGPMHVVSGISRYADAVCLKISDYEWNAKQVRACYDLWYMKTDPIPKPKAWAFKSDPQLTYNRLPWDLDINTPTPLWDAWLKRTSDPLTIKTWIGSLFFEKSYRQQYLYIHGDGNDGKGCLARFIESVFANDYFEVLKEPKNQFFGTFFDGKRIVCFSDLRDPAYVRSDVVMGLTGGSTIPLERKGKDVVRQETLVKLLFLANDPPSVKLSEHDLRRILYVSISQPSVEERMADWNAYEQGLFDQGGGFLAQCIKSYHDNCPNHEAIKQNEEHINTIRQFAIDPLGDEMEDFAYDKFTFHPKLEGQKTTDRCFVTAETVMSLVAIKWPKDTAKFLERFKKWVIQNRGVECGQKSMGQLGKPRVYFGMGLKHGVKTDKNEWQFIGW